MGQGLNEYANPLQAAMDNLLVKAVSQMPSDEITKIFTPVHRAFTNLNSNLRDVVDYQRR
jgi:hypothetical protein